MNASQKKLIVIVGTTAVGKTKLSVELAKRIYNGPHEVISADSVQVTLIPEASSNKPLCFVTLRFTVACPLHLLW